MVTAIPLPDSPSLPRMFLRRAERAPQAPALWYKSQGTYRYLTWRQFSERVRQVALALHYFGIRKGDRVGILSENRPEWAFADLGALSLGAASVPIYPTTAPRECGYILEHSGISLLFVSTPEQFEKISPFVGKGELARVVVFDAPASLPSNAHVFKECLEIGRIHHLNNGNLYDQLVDKVSRDDVATIIYTSGTTGPPKGVMLTHDNFLSNCEAAAKVLPLREGEKSLSFLPLSHVFERMAGYYFMILCGASIAYAESMQTVPEDLLLVRPTVAASVPRLYEKMHARILEAVEAGPALKRALFFWALSVGRKTGKSREAYRPLPPGLALRFVLAQRLVFNKLKRRLGGRIRFFISGGAPLSKDLAEFFFAAGVLILEGYGLTETSPVITVNRPERFTFGTVGLPLPGVEVKIGAEGEILTRGPHVMKGYFHNEEATREALREGWFHTGDIGEIDGDGFLRITDRKKDLIKTAGGKLISPQNLEAEVLKDPLFTQVVALGDKRPYLVALAVPNRSHLEKLAQEEHIQAPGWEALLQHPKILEIAEARVRARLKDLAPYEQIQYVYLLAKELTQESGELTPTLKVKRRLVMERYAAAIESLYARGEKRGKKNPLFSEMI